MPEELLHERRAKIIKETAEAYTLNTRAVISGSVECYYYKASTGRSCAVGRLVSKEIALKLNGPVDACFKDLPEDIQILGRDFLFQLQKFHDHEENWTPTGLSAEGKETVERLLNNYGSPKSETPANP